MTKRNAVRGLKVSGAQAPQKNARDDVKVSSPLAKSGVTAKSLLAQSRRTTITNGYAVAARDYERKGAQLLKCPHCGTEDQLLGKIDLSGRKKLVDVPLTAEWKPEWGKPYESELEVAFCLSCKSGVEPTAYTCPYAYLIDAIEPLSVADLDVTKMRAALDAPFDHHPMSGRRRTVTRTRRPE